MRFWPFPGMHHSAGLAGSSSFQRWIAIRPAARLRSPLVTSALVLFLQRRPLMRFFPLQRFPVSLRPSGAASHPDHPASAIRAVACHPQPRAVRPCGFPFSPQLPRRHCFCHCIFNGGIHQPPGGHSPADSSGRAFQTAFRGSETWSVLLRSCRISVMGGAMCGSVGQHSWGSTLSTFGHWDHVDRTSGIKRSGLLQARPG
jgi:hypothetical protein